MNYGFLNTREEARGAELAGELGEVRPMFILTRGVKSWSKIPTVFRHAKRDGRAPIDVSETLFRFPVGVLLKTFGEKLGNILSPPWRILTHDRRHLSMNPSESVEFCPDPPKSSQIVKTEITQMQWNQLKSNKIIQIRYNPPKSIQNAKF